MYLLCTWVFLYLCICVRCAFLRWSWGILAVVVQNRPLTPICWGFPGFHTIHITHHIFLKPASSVADLRTSMCSVFLGKKLSSCGFNQNALTSHNCMESCPSYYYIAINQITCVRERMVALVSGYIVFFFKNASISDLIFLNDMSSCASSDFSCKQRITLTLVTSCG